MSQIETVIRASKQLEQLLEQQYAASGRGLHEKTSSIEAQLDSDTVRRLRKIATLRNKVVHEDFEIEDLVEFQSDAQHLVNQLQPQAVKKNSKPRTAKATAPKATVPIITAPKSTAPKAQRAANNPAKAPTPRAQPRVQLPNQTSQATPNPLNATAKKSIKTQPQPAAASRHTLLPTISGLLVFVAIIWILAH